MPDQVSKINLTEKAGFVIFSCLAVLFLVLGALNIKSRLTSPFAKKEISNASAADQSMADLKNKDTDHDGLSDYDELYLYNTSPYIADTDSDGISDGEEVKAGSDPNCPKGKVCLPEEPAATSPTPVAPIQPTPDTGSVDMGQALPAPDVNSIAPTAQAIRDALKQQGIDDATLQGVDDATLLKMYDDAVKAQQAAPQQ